MSLAIEGGKPVREKPFPVRCPYDIQDVLQVTQALQSQDLFYSTGTKAKQFEKEFSKQYGVEYAVTCSSGTAAVHMAIAAIDAEPGDEVIVAPVTDFGTVIGCLCQGLIPVFSDWKPDMFNMDPSSIERNITDRTKAIIAVHLFGNPCDMDSIMKIAKAHDLVVIEDCAQAYFTEYKGKYVGSIGDIGCFSMQQSKHLPTGEGGVTVTTDSNYAMRMSLFRDKGWENRGVWGSRAYTFLGMNYRMNELTGALAFSQLSKTKNVVEQMRFLGDRLTQRITGVPGLLPCPVTEGGKHSYWLYAIKVLFDQPQEYVKALAAEGIPCSWGYTVDPIYLCTEALTKKRTFGTSQYPFTVSARDIRYEAGLCPVAEAELKCLCTLRIYESWTCDDVDDVVAAIKKVSSAF